MRSWGRYAMLVNEARRFAVLMHGAALLYNVLLAERAEELGLSQHEGRRNYFTNWLDQWRDDIEASDLRGWNPDQLWALVARQGRPVSPPTRAFVDPMGHPDTGEHWPCIRGTTPMRAR